MRKLLISFFVFMLAITTFCVHSFASQDRQKLTCAFDVLAENYKMTKTGMVNENMSFSPADFQQGIGVSDVSYVTFTNIPELSEGYLRVGEMRVNEGQKVYSELLCMLEFVCASEQIDRVSFCISGDDNTSGADIECTLRFIDSLNYAPTVSITDESRLSLCALSGKSTSGVLSADDPEGDRVRFEVVRYPSHGVLSSFDMNSGRFVYVAADSYSGHDMFEYVAVDEYGNYTSPERVDIRVDADRSGIVLSDMIGRGDSSAAVYVLSKGIMTGAVKGGAYSFFPEMKIKRAEFIMMALKAAGKMPEQDLSALDDIADIDSVSEECRGYIAAALKEGYISQGGGGIYFIPLVRI